VVTVARRGDLTIKDVAADFDISPESVRRWMRQADVDDGVKHGLTSAEQSEYSRTLIRRPLPSLYSGLRSPRGGERSSPFRRLRGWTWSA
jgi:transposase-like protein